MFSFHVKKVWENQALLLGNIDKKFSNNPSDKYLMFSYDDASLSWENNA